VPWLGVAETKLSPAGNGSLTCTLVAVSGPLLCSVTVNMMVSPTLGVWDETSLSTARSALGPPLTTTPTKRMGWVVAVLCPPSAMPAALAAPAAAVAAEAMTAVRRKRRRLCPSGGRGQGLRGFWLTRLRLLVKRVTVIIWHVRPPLVTTAPEMSTGSVCSLCEPSKYMRRTPVGGKEGWTWRLYAAQAFPATPPFRSSCET